MMQKKRSVANIGILFIVFLLPAFHASAQSTGAVLVFKGKAEMQFPVQYRPMNEKAVVQRYPFTTVKPSEAYSGPDSIVVFAFIPQQQKKTADEIVAAKEGIFDTYRKSTRIKWINGEVRSINYQKYLVLSFYSGRSSFEVFNYQIFGSIKGELVLISVTCPVSSLDQKKAEIEQIIGSFRIK